MRVCFRRFLKVCGEEIGIADEFLCGGLETVCAFCDGCEHRLRFGIPFQEEMAFCDAELRLYQLAA